MDKQPAISYTRRRQLRSGKRWTTKTRDAQPKEHLITGPTNANSEHKELIP